MQNAEQNAGASLRGRLRETCRPEERLRVMQRLPAVPASAFLVDIYIFTYICMYVPFLHKTFADR